MLNTKFDEAIKTVRAGGPVDLVFFTGDLGPAEEYAAAQHLARVITNAEVTPDLLRWHVQTQLDTPEQQESELLFPSVRSRCRTTTGPQIRYSSTPHDSLTGLIFGGRSRDRTCDSTV